MKIHSLEIKNIRGIRDLSLTPNGKNLVIWGNNGSGKSAVVDALDFLLTGKMNRLTGDGTAGISLLKHGSHIDCDTLDKAYVIAKIELPSKEVFEIKRCLGDATNIIEINDKPLEPLSDILNLANRGQHVLTRREILKFVTATGQTRSKEIQNLLNINEIEEIRSIFVKVRTTQKSAVQTSKVSLSQAEKDIQSTTNTNIRIFDEAKVLDFINQNRKLLSAVEINELKYTNLKNDIIPVAAIKNEPTVNQDLIVNDIRTLNESISQENQKLIIAAEGELASIIQEINSDAKNLLSLRQKRLIDLGIEMLGDGYNCPLCDLKWENDELVSYLHQKQEKAEFVTNHKSKIELLTKTLIAQAQSIISNVTRLSKSLRQLKMDSEAVILENWRKRLEDIVAFTTKIPSEFEFNSSPSQLLSSNFLISNLSEIGEALIKKAEESLPRVTPEQTAWDSLTRLGENLKVYERQLKDFEKNELNNKRAATLLESFQNARDEVLQGLYDEVRGTFEVLYKELHGSDEKGFASDLQSSGAAIKFEVDFYGRGLHPPHAMHSEGHQDSMGLCLYLALSEKLTKGFLDIVILDDVVMSVDIEHRKQLCSVLLKNFPDKQFVITTHDQTWARMLRKENVVNGKGLKEFANWTVETGPNVNDYEDLWEKIAKDISSNDVNSAAAKLRRGLEQFFYEVCEKLQAQIRFKSGGQWDLGDLSDAGISSLKKVISKAQVSAKSWDNEEREKEINQYEKNISAKIAAAAVDQWLINPNVHYTNWMNLLPSEFEQTVFSHRELVNVFSCDNSKCQSLFYITKVGMESDSFRCRCGKVNWTLNKK